MTKSQRIIAQLHSWKTGYIAPTAQILMGDAAELIQEQMDTIQALDAALEEERKKDKQTTKKDKTAPNASDDGKIEWTSEAMAAAWEAFNTPEEGDMERIEAGEERVALKRLLNAAVKVQGVVRPVKKSRGKKK